MTSLKKATINATTWNFIKIMTGQVRSFIVSIILARLLMPEDFGLIGMAMVFAGIADSFVDFGFGNAIIQTKEVNQTQKSTVFYINMLLGCFLTLIMYATAPLIALYFEMPLLKSIAQLMSVTFIIKGLSSLQSALLKKELNYKIPFKVEIISSVISAIFGIYLAYTGYGVWSLVYSQMLGWVISTLLLWFYSSWKPSLKFELSSIKELWRFGYKYSTSVFIDMLFSRLDTIVIGKILSAATLGLFYKAQSLNRLVIQYAFSSFSTVLFPSFSKINNDKERLRESLHKVLHIVGFTTFFFSGLMVINAEELIVLLYTEKWLGAVPIFKFIGLFSFIYTFPTVLNTPILSIGLSGKILKIELIKKSLYLLAIPIGIMYGLYGYLSGVVIASILGMSLNVWLIVKYISYSVHDFYKLLLIYALPFIGTIVFVNYLGSLYNLNSFYSLIIKTIAYTAFMLLYHALAKSLGFIIIRNLVIEHIPFSKK